MSRAPLSKSIQICLPVFKLNGFPQNWEGGEGVEGWLSRGTDRRGTAVLTLADESCLSPRLPISEQSSSVSV